MKKQIINIAGNILMLLSLVFIVRRAMSMDIQWSQLKTVQVAALVLLMPLQSVLLIFIASYCWKKVLSLFTDKPIYAGNAFNVYAKANIMKYLPGNVMHYLARQMFAESLGIKQLHMSASTILELSYSAIAQFLVGVLLATGAVIALFQNIFENSKWIAALITLVVCLTIFILGSYYFRRNRYVSQLLELIRRIKFWKAYGFAILCCILGTILQGITYVLLLSMFTPVDLNQAVVAIAGCSVSYFIGMVTPGVPGGIGVRETAMLLILSAFLPSEAVILAAVTQRVIFIIGDIICVPISEMLIVKGVDSE